MAHQEFKVPPEREWQFDLIAIASEATIKGAQSNGWALQYIYPVVPFVETDSSLDAWLFVDTESTLQQYQSSGTADALASLFRSELAKVAYPTEWLQAVRCHFGSKEVVDRDYRGSYYNFLR